MTWERVKAGHYRCGKWEAIQAKPQRWEVWDGEVYIHAFRTLTEARDFILNEVR